MQDPPLVRTPNGEADLLSGDDGPATAVPSSLGLPPYGEDGAGTPYDLESELAELGAPKGTGRDPDGCGARSPTKKWRPSSKRSGSSKKNCEELANQTSKIMHDYQAYLAEISMDNRNGSSSEDEVDSANPRLASVHRAREDVIGSYEEKQADMMEDGYQAPSGSFAATGDGDAAGGGQLQRAWVYDDNTGRDDESPFGSAGTYAQSFLRSRRAKRGMVMVAVAVVALIVLGVSVGNTRGEGSVAQLEEFDEEYKAEEMDRIEEDYEAQKQKAQADAYELEVATAAQAQKEYYAERERDDVPTLSYSSGAVGETTKEDGDEKKPASSNAHLSAEEVDLYAGAVEKYQPAMFDRSYGYAGTTFVDAENWCSSMSMTLCPYEAICPDGAGSEPLGGYRRGVNSDFAWIPVLGHNDWVQAEVKESCNRYSDLVGDAPGWGINGEADAGGENVEALTRNIMCCKNPDEADTKGGKTSGATDVASGVSVAKVTTKPPEPTSKCMDDPTFVHANLKTCETFVAHVGRVPLHQSRCAQSTGITGKDGTEVLVKHFCRKSCGECGEGDASAPAAAHIDKHTQDLYFEEVKKWQPKMFDRTKGYTGITYMDARVWCSSLSMSLCPLEAVCPGGPGSEPLGGYRRGVDSNFAWIPVAAGRPNEWVQVESRESCTTYSDMHDGKGPGWGIAGGEEGVGAETLTRNVMCCRNVM